MTQDASLLNTMETEKVEVKYLGGEGKKGERGRGRREEEGWKTEERSDLGQKY